MKKKDSKEEIVERINRTKRISIFGYLNKRQDKEQEEKESKKHQSKKEQHQAFEKRYNDNVSEIDYQAVHFQQVFGKATQKSNEEKYKDEGR